MNNTEGLTRRPYIRLMRFELFCRLYILFPHPIATMCSPKCANPNSSPRGTNPNTDFLTQNTLGK